MVNQVIICVKRPNTLITEIILLLSKSTIPCLLRKNKRWRIKFFKSSILKTLLFTISNPSFNALKLILMFKTSSNYICISSPVFLVFILVFPLFSLASMFKEIHWLIWIKSKSMKLCHGTVFYGAKIGLSEPTYSRETVKD